MTSQRDSSSTFHLTKYTKKKKSDRSYEEIILYIYMLFNCFILDSRFTKRSWIIILINITCFIIFNLFLFKLRFITAHFLFPVLHPYPQMLNHNAHIKMSWMAKKYLKTKIFTTQIYKNLIFHTRSPFTHSLHMLAVHLSAAECKSTVITRMCRCAAGKEHSVNLICATWDYILMCKQAKNLYYIGKQEL